MEKTNYTREEVNQMKPLRTLVFLLALAGCSLTKPAVIQVPTEGFEAFGNPGQLVNFPKDYKGKTMKTKPQTWTDFYGGGTWLFRDGNYELAINYFMEAANIARGEARRTCLIAAAVSALAANDLRFLEIREELEKSRDVNPFSRKTVTDKAADMLEEIVRHPREGEQL